MATVSQKGGIYIEINGDVKPLEEQLQKAKKVSRTVADDIAKTTKNAFSTKAMNGIADSITRSFGSIQSSIRSLNTDTKAFASQFSALGKEIGLTTAQANILGNSISNALKVKEEGRIVQHLRNIQRQTGMTVDEMKKLSQELGVSDKQFEMFSSRASKSMSSMSKLGSAAKTAGIAIAATTATLGVFAKATLEASMALERLQAAYSTIYGDKNAAASQLEFIRQQTKAVGQQYMETAEAAKAFFASGQNSTLAPEMNKIFTAISNAGAALQLTQDDINGVFRAFGQMISKGKVQAEELRGQVGERLPGAFKMAAEAMGMSTAELDKFMADGKLVAEDLLPKLEKVMNEKFAGAAKNAADTLQGSLNNMYSEWEQFKANIAASGPAKFFVQIITEALANKNAEYSKQERENQAKEYLRKTGAPALNLPGGANGRMIEFSENQIAQASAQLQMMNAINTISKQASDTLQKNMEEAVSQYRQSTTSILKNSKETKLRELEDQKATLKSRKEANDKAIEYEFNNKKITAEKRNELLADSQKRFDSANKEIEKNIKKTKEAAENAGKSGAGAANRAANAQANYNTTLENTRSHIESMEEQLKLDKTESLTAKKIAISEKYEEQIRRVNNEIDKQVRSGSISAVQGDELKKLRQKELTLEKTLKLRELENQEIEKNLSHLQEQLSFYNELAEMTGNFTTSMELQNQIIDIQAQKYRDLKTIPEELIQEWANWKKLEASTDPFDGAYRGLKKFSAEYGNSAKQWESIANSFAVNFEKTCHDMFDDFLETGKMSFDNLWQLFKNLLKQMAYQALVQPVVLSVVNGVAGAVYGGTTAANGAVGAVGTTSSGISSIGNALTSTAVGYVANQAKDSVMGSASGWLTNSINSAAASLFPSTFAPTAEIASSNVISNALGQAGQAALSNGSYVMTAGGGNAAAQAAQLGTNAPTYTASSLMNGYSMGGGLVGGLGASLISPALFGNSTGTSIGTSVGSALGSVGSMVAASVILGNSWNPIGWGGALVAGIGALLGGIGGGGIGSLFGGGYEDEPGYYINTYTDLTKKEGLAGYKEGTAIQNHRWDSFSDSTASAMRDKVARPLMTQLRENTVALHEQIVALGGENLGESFFAAVRKHQGSGDKRTGKGGIELSDYFHVHGEWHETNSPDVEKWAKQIGEQYQKVIVKSIANMDMKPITIAADGMVADTEEEIAIALAKAGSLISVGDAIEDEKLKESFEKGISKSLVAALKDIDTSDLGLTIDKSSLAGWQTAIQAMAAWQEATNAIELMKNPISEITSQLGALDTQFLQWKATLEQLGWQEQKVKEIEEERIDALYRTSSEYLDKYIEKDSTVSGIEERFNDIEDILKALTDSGAKEADSDEYKALETKGRTILKDFINASLEQYKNAESAADVLEEGSAVFSKVLAQLRELDADDSFDVVTHGLIDSVQKSFDVFKNKAKEQSLLANKQAREEIRTSLAAYGKQNEYRNALQQTNDAITEIIKTMKEMGYTSQEVAEAERLRTKALREQALELTRQTDQSLNLRIKALQYGSSSSQYQIQNSLYQLENERNDLEKQFGRESLQYRTAAQVQEAELIQLKIDILQNQLKELMTEKIEEVEKEISAAQSLKSTFDSIRKSLKTAVSNLWTGENNLSTSRYNEAYKRFNATYAKALQGDQEALNELPTIANTVLSLGREQLKTRRQYEDAFYDINGKLKSAELYAASQVQKADSQINTAQSQLDALKAQEAAINGQTEVVTGSIDSILAEIEALKNELSEKLSTLIVSTDTMAANLSTRELLLQAKADQLNETAYLGRTDWTPTNTLEEIYNKGLTLESWYEKYGKNEGLGVQFDAIASVLENASQQEMAILEKKLEYLNEGYYKKVGDPNSWTMDSLVQKLLSSNLTINDWYEKYGKKEFASIEQKTYQTSKSYSLTTQGQTLALKAALMNMGQTLSAGQKAGGWTMQSVLEAIEANGMSFDDWYNKYGKHEIEEAAQNAGFLANNSVDVSDFTNSILDAQTLSIVTGLNNVKGAVSGLELDPTFITQVNPSIPITLNPKFTINVDKNGNVTTSTQSGTSSGTVNPGTSSTTSPSSGSSGSSGSSSSSINVTYSQLSSQAKSNLSKKAAAMNQGYTLASGQTAGGWTAQSVYDRIIKGKMTYDDWWSRYGASEMASLNKKTTTSTKYTSDYNLLVAKANDMNRGINLGKGQTAGGWTAKKVEDYIKSLGYSVAQWYTKWGKSEGYVKGGVTPKNKAYWVGENGPELLMSPNNYGILNNRDSIELMRAGYGGATYNMDSDNTEVRESNNILRQLLRKIDSQEYEVKKLRRVIDQWNAEGMPAVAMA